MDKKILLLDFGAVLYDIDFTRTKSALEKLCRENSIIDFSAESQLDLFSEFEKGIFSTEEFLNTFKNLYCEDSVSINEITEAWNALLIAPFIETENVIGTLKEKGYTLAIVSNTNELHYQHFLPKSISFLEKFDFLFFSHQIRRRKPDKDFFEYVLTTMNCTPTEVNYIDDSIQHLTSAKELGITSFQKVPEFALSELLHSVKIIKQL